MLILIDMQGFSTTLSNPIGIRLVLLGLVVMPATELVLPFNVNHYNHLNRAMLNRSRFLHSPMLLRQMP